jgi:hypothetical protein
MDKYTLPREQCEWCGREYVWVRVLPLQSLLSIRLDVDPVAIDDQRAKYGRVNPATVEGKIDCVLRLNKENRATFKRGWTPHKDTCPQAQSWSGHKKRVVTKRDLDELLAAGSPEMDRYPDPSGRTTRLP